MIKDVKFILNKYFIAISNIKYVFLLRLIAIWPLDYMDKNCAIYVQYDINIYLNKIYFR